MSDFFEEWGGAMFWVGVIALIVWGSFGESDSSSQSTTTSGSTYYGEDYDTYEYEDYSSDPSYYSDPNDEYEYNYRTGYSGSYGFNYDVSGSDENGDSVYGSVDTQGKYGDGYIYDDYGNEIYVETEWVDYGVIEATDEYGNTYELETE